MPWGEVGAFLVVLVAVFAAGSLWFHLVEGALDRLRRLLLGRREPPAWHTLPEEETQKEDRDK